MGIGGFKCKISMINYKGKLLDRESFDFHPINRGLAFGDGLFETMIATKANIAFFELHWNRLISGLNALSIKNPFHKELLEKYILKLIESQKEESNLYRVKLIVWRSGAGKYAPEHNEADFIIEANSTSKINPSIVGNCYLSKNINLYPTAYSHLKTISALNYVMAAKEKQERGVEELLIANHQGMLAEATSSNIIIYQHDEKCFYTPPLGSACIDGVMRRHLINSLEQAGKPIIEKPIAPDDLQQNTSLFLCNVTGLRQVANFENRKLAEDQQLFELLCHFTKH